MKRFIAFCFLLMIKILLFCFGCHNENKIEFAKKFYEVEEEFKKKYESAEELDKDIVFKDTLTLCAFPYNQTDLGYFSKAFSDPTRFTIALFISQRLKIPIRIAFPLKDVFDYNCDSKACTVGNEKIHHTIYAEERSIQEGYTFKKIKVESEYGNIEINLYQSPNSEFVASISLVSQEGYTESLTFASNITQVEDIKEAKFIFLSDQISCYSIFSIAKDQRRFEIYTENGGKYEKFSGIIERNPSCPQKPKGVINSSSGAETIGESCDFPFESSNIERVFRIMEENYEKKGENLWLKQMRKISEKFGIFEDEVKLIDFVNEINQIEISSLLLYDGEKLKETESRLKTLREILGSIKIAFPYELKVKIFDFSLPLTYQVNETEKKFLEAYIDFLQFIISYISSLNLELEESLRNQIINVFGGSENLTTKDKVEIFVRAIRSSPNFLKTQDMTKREEAYSYLKSALFKIHDFTESLKIPEKTGFFAFIKGIPSIPSSITEIPDDFVDHKTLSSYLQGISGLIKAIFSPSESSFVFVLDKVAEKWWYNAFKINIKKLILSDLRDILPAIYPDRDNFVIEWECGIKPPLRSYEEFPETITCGNSTIQDTKHFPDPSSFYDGYTMIENPFYDTGLEQDGYQSAFPYIFFHNPTFSGSLSLLRPDFFNDVCESFTGKKRSICETIEFFAFIFH